MSVSRGRNAVDWSGVAVPVTEHEDRMPADDAQRVWNEIYRLFNAAGESAQLEVRLAVYAYYAVNGASTQTKHSREISTGGGEVAAASDVMKCIGVQRIRQFLRSDVREAYDALKDSEVLEADEVAVSKAEEKGIPKGCTFLMADFLRGCPSLTPEEKKIADSAFIYSIARARGARGGLTVEQIGDNTRQAKLLANTERPVPVRGGESGVYSEF